MEACPCGVELSIGTSWTNDCCLFRPQFTCFGRDGMMQSVQGLRVEVGTPSCITGRTKVSLHNCHFSGKAAKRALTCAFICSPSYERVEPHRTPYCPHCALTSDVRQHSVCVSICSFVGTGQTKSCTPPRLISRFACPDLRESTRKCSK